MNMLARVEKIEQRLGRGSRGAWEKWRAEGFKIADEFLGPYIAWCTHGRGKKLGALASHAEYRLRMEENEKRRPLGESPFAPVKLCSAEDLAPFVRGRSDDVPVKVEGAAPAVLEPARAPVPKGLPDPPMPRGLGPVSKLPGNERDEQAEVDAINFLLEMGGRVD